MGKRSFGVYLSKVKRLVLESEIGFFHVKNHGNFNN